MSDYTKFNDIKPFCKRAIENNLPCNPKQSWSFVHGKRSNSGTILKAFPHFFRITITDEIHIALKRLENKKTSGFEDIPSFIIYI